MTVENLDIIRTVMRYVVPGASAVLNVFTHRFQGTTATDSDVLDAVAAWALDEWGDTWANIASNLVNLSDVHCQVVDLDGTVVRDLGIAIVDRDGDVAADVLPAAVSAYIQLATGFPAVIGRKYVPGIDEGATTGGVLTAGAATQLALLLLDYLAPINPAGGGDMFPGVVSSKEAGFKSFISGGLFNVVPAYQRRRKQGVGE